MKDTELIAQLADIQPPPAPDSGIWAITLLLALAISAVGAFIYLYKYRNRPVPGTLTHDGNAGALERLGKLEREWLAGGIDDRQAAFRLAALIRLGLGQTQWPKANDDQAHALGEQLSRLRYERTPRTTLDRAIFESARACLLEGTATKC